MKKTITFLMLIILTSVYRPMIDYFLPDLEADYATLLRKALQAGTVILFITICGLWSQVGVLTRISKKSILILLPIFLLSFVTYVFGVEDKSLLDVILLIVVTLLIGVIEELEFRGVIYTFLEEQKLFAIMVSSALFGLVHFLNLFYNPDVMSVIVQVIFATGFGMVMAVVRFKTNLLLPQILMHALWDFNQKITNSSATNPISDLLAYSALALVVLWGLFLVYRVNSQDRKSGLTPQKSTV